jgi:UDP-glucose 4-epimerase
MRVLVTGGGGFLGAAMVRALLARGDIAIAFDVQLGHLLAAAPAERFIAVQGDVTDMAAVVRAVLDHKPDAILHAAAIVGVRSSASSPINVVRVNVEGSINVFETMRLGGVHRCVHISSEEVYGAFSAEKIDETHALNPALPYGICKTAVEQLGRGYRDLYGLDIVHLRTSWVYGPGLPRNRIPKNLIEAALGGRPLYLASGADTAIDHTHVDDFVSGAWKTLDHQEHRFDAYNLASGEATTISRLVAIVSELIPGAALSVGPGPYRHGDQLEMPRKGALDISRAARELGWVPHHDIRSGLASYIAALKRT